MTKTTGAVLAAAAFWPWLLGCDKSVAIDIQPRLSLDDLTPGLSEPENAYHLLDNRATVGRFACGLAIARFESIGTAFAPHLELSDIEPAEQAYWIEAFRGVSSIREMVFFSSISSENGRRDPESLCAVARRHHAPLLLIYTSNRYGPNTAQVLGVLYDVESVTPIATLHSAARFVNESGVETAPEGEDDDLRDSNALYQAARAFENHSRICMTALIALDSPSPTKQPHDWDKPWPERWWVPKVIKAK